METILIFALCFIGIMIICICTCNAQAKYSDKYETSSDDTSSVGSSSVETYIMTDCASESSQV
jgi:hypothetical protein